MTLSTLRPASQMLAYLPEVNADKLAELLVAFANGDGGTIVVGADEAGKPLGRVFPEEIEGVLRSAERMCRPVIHTGWEHTEGPGGVIFAITIARSPELHSLHDGRVLIRMGAQNQPLGGEEIKHLAATKSAGDYEIEAAPGAKRDDLDE
jgi:ATP-dependent DNA helicase RecG